MRLFVYGSLKKGFFNHKRFGFDKLNFLGEKVIKGYALINLGQYPGMVNADPESTVKGEIYEIDDGTSEFNHLNNVEKGAGFTFNQVNIPGEELYAFLFAYGEDEGMRIDGGEWKE